jgi:hypothetical protein
MKGNMRRPGESGSNEFPKEPGEALDKQGAVGYNPLSQERNVNN